MSNINVNNITPVTGTKVSVSGSLHASGDITANGNITLGDATTDSVTFSAEISSSIIPDANNVYDLGTTSKQWKNIYASTGSFGNLSGSITFSNNVTFQNITATSGTISYISSSSPTVFAGDIEPDADDSNNIGSSTKKWKDLYIDGTAYIDNVSASVLTTSGNMTLGSFSGNSLIFNAWISSSIIPYKDDAFDLGYVTHQWKDLYIDGVGHIDKIQAGDATIAQAGIGTANININSLATASFHTSASLSSICFENLPTSYAVAQAHGSGTLFRSQSMSGGGMALFIS